jgi:hypothetical protein
VFGSVDDLARFAEVLLNGQDDVLSATSKAAMLTPQTTTYKADYESYSYGFFVWDKSRYGVEVVNHGGSGLGYVGMFLMVPDHRFAVSVLANHDGFYKTSGLAVSAMMRFLDLDDPPPPNNKTDPATWDKFTGTYHDPTSLGNMTIWMAGEALGVSLEGAEQTATMMQFFPNVFYFYVPAGHPMAGKAVSATFILDEAGKAQYISTPYGVAARVE